MYNHLDLSAVGAVNVVRSKDSAVDLDESTGDRVAGIDESKDSKIRHACLIGNCKETFKEWSQAQKHMIHKCRMLKKLDAERKNERMQESKEKASQIHSSLGTGTGIAFACLADMCNELFNNWNGAMQHLEHCKVVKRKHLGRLRMMESKAKAKLIDGC